MAGVHPEDRSPHNGSARVLHSAQDLITHPQLFAYETCACGNEVDLLESMATSRTPMLACLAEMARTCGVSARVKVTGIFNSVDPTSQQRMT